MPEQFILSGFSDEIADDVQTQFAELNKCGISYFEPRGINGKNISDLDDQEVAALKDEMQRFGIQVSSIGSPIGKIQITDPFAPHLEKLRRVIAIAHALGTEYIRVFSFYLPQGAAKADYREEVLNRMHAMAELAKAEDVTLLHENEKGIYGDMAADCLDILQSVASPALWGVFDPANFVQCGQAVYPEAYTLLKPYIRYVHIKDALADGSVVPAGYGIGCVKEVLTALKDSGYQGFLSLEPHLGSFQGLAALEQGDEMLQLEQSDAEKFETAHKALLNILNEVK